MMDILILLSIAGCCASGWFLLDGLRKRRAYHSMRRRIAEESKEHDMWIKEQSDIGKKLLQSTHERLVKTGCLRLGEFGDTDCLHHVESVLESHWRDYPSVVKYAATARAKIRCRTASVSGERRQVRKLG